ncbi:ABC transporter ATP-binding protein [Liquorilactobacillus mali]|uniref:ABC transporter domain-containing protein n=1 Tax=Liquorilactobacillus mali KCTC 3596 = DSM 20444 TaxID=1046596 RepID=J0L5X9_9LACO|nr:ABC transporter ATP-binding protein [Liquorilactobacillus mali]EJE99851.1 ABC transporter ATP-binding protein [Liquorilactobacillus mali KCTC 3596 = DSM 20444]KRN10344.1 hypothetical protein FD00_GL000291 [Liquorilactobacillus mali KCTC 3596 = DSM 20444]MDC7953378.1 ABC transporter ATP-binding protein [Liquorilactobacillus mali]QFQ75504.1 ABC transporter ATP-binding protein [Liquorilactobacillus mali]
MGKILEFKDVSLKRGEKVILKEVNWTIKSKENWAILGLNGAGKTTMLKMIHGDLWPSSGQLEVLGNIFGKSNISLLRRKIGWVSSALQDWLHPGDLVEQIVLSGKFASIGLYENYTVAEMQEAKDQIARLGGVNLIGKTYRVLSQGERQLVLIARALMAKPELLILDEPCNGLDLFARERLLSKIATLASSEDSPALLMVSHYTEEILPCFSKIMFLKKGKIYAAGQRETLLTTEKLSDFYEAPINILMNESRRVVVYPK